MRKIFIITTLLPALLACNPPLFDQSSREQPDSGRTPPPSLRDTTQKEPDVYVTAIMFPDSVNWRKGGTEGATLVLLKNAQVVMSLPAGPRPRADNHCYQDGHLWVNDTDGFQTTVSCDGSTLFAYPGEEQMPGFLIDNGQVHTLGQKPGGGFCYRIDGMEAFTSREGIVLGEADDPDWPGGALMRDTSGVHFTYGISHQSADAEVWEYRIMNGTDIRKELTMPAGGKLFDVRVHDGKLYRLEWRYGRYCLIVDEVLTPLPAEGAQQGLKLLTVNGNIMVKGFEIQNRELVCWLQGADTLRYEYGYPRLPVGDLLIEGDRQYALVMDGEDCVLLIYRGEEFIARFPPETYGLHTQRSIALRKGILALALTHDDADENLLWVNGKEYPLRFNGYFTGVYIE